ncbi:basic amino acid ABC transporter substrate-binding protein [Caldisericum exile]|uniref:Amino acid ABC transporter substrate binding protein n=1 Tax=Caldisericum exile (strain DSM 21853 / NBRC 104410 / AZM16c01) TaxID=511051 RepID=A0A7U6GFQ2_CALEA|nr:basic amino acid ABC transporter substrate-binding protein [Caldisericum exile]BAL81476.1 amino acid ABC transporter substrate binding protein [Caldisericum exile AZM16c01]
MKKVLIIFVVVLLFLPLFSGCAKKESILKVGTSADYPPFEYVDEKTKEFVGFDLDLMRLLGKKMGYDKVEIVNMDFDTIIPSLQTDKIDVGAACITITNERLQQADAVPYLSTGQSILVKKDSPFTPKTFEDLSNHKIGVQKGTTGEEAIDKAVTDGKIKNADIRRYTSVVLAITDLQNGNIDAVVIDTPVATYYSTKQDFKVTGELVSEEAGLFVKKGNTELKSKLEKALSEIKGTQEWVDLINKYFGGQ